jgi:hypothetical protein
MSVHLSESLLNNRHETPQEQAGYPGRSRPRRKGSWASPKHIQMFIHGGESSIVTEQGEYNVYRRVPRFVKYYLNWTRDTFPTIIRLPWTSLILLFVGVEMLTIAVFAAILRALDGSHERECVTNASTYMDFFYFVVHTFFTIGFGSMSPVCGWSNLMVLIISLFSMFQTATFTGIFFAKFSLDPRRSFACAFTTKLVGMPPGGFDEEAQRDEMVRLNFRFVNVFHRRYFKVSCRLYLVEHRMNSVTEEWLSPTVEELKYFDTSAPLEFMSLPIEVCFYVPFSRLVRHQPGMLSPMLSPRSVPEESEFPPQRSLHSQQWIRHVSREYKSHSKALSDPPTPRTLSIQRDADLPIQSTYEIVAMLVYTDSSTGCEIAVRKSWPLANTVWLSPSEPYVKWKNIIHRDANADKYLVDVTGLDLIDNRPDSLLPPIQEEAASPFAASSSYSDVAFQLINAMTVPSQGGHVRRARVGELFPSPLPEERV